MEFFNQSCALVDLETTGTNPIYDRITEIAVIHFSAQGERHVWQSLINPGQGIPDQIVSLTGISNDMVREAPAFGDIAQELLEILQDSVLVAHNARFDYGFLKNAFKREDIAYRPRIICSVKLSRALYPAERYHNLNIICQRFNIERNQAHRALADAEAMERVLENFAADNAPEQVEQAIARQLARPALPMHIEQQQIDALPKSAGVYRFYGEAGSLLYVGKSINLHARVLSHFSGDHSNVQDMKLVQSIRSLDFECTGGDLGAQLLEARQIKELSPVLNRRQRRYNSLFCYKLEPNDQGYLVPVLVDRPTQGCYWDEHYYGLYRNRSAAKKALSSLSDEHALCKKMLGIEKGKGACFGYQLKKCRGVCLGRESAEMYNLRLEAALLKHRVNVWPYNGVVTVPEYDEAAEKTYFHLIYHWAYLGSCHCEADLPVGENMTDAPRFDIDSYRIIQRYFRSHPDKIRPL